ncbi:hypothetical protein F511_46304 [Dorcoceras hygrometricum]|uniref:Uncharacterized protein n=1 Tax=Dorcoceras hygrometricum TaxID=472368 RepID=A0A2Z6ZUZ1_9LAMI|nr:hypothetical protein F511_46304 [Dorcoceras hygrometricum]
MAAPHHLRRANERARRLRAGRAWRATAGHVQRNQLRVLGAMSRMDLSRWPRAVAPPVVRWPRYWRDGGWPAVHRWLREEAAMCARWPRNPKHGGRPAVRRAMAHDDHWARDVARGRASRLARHCARAAARFFVVAAPPAAASPAKLRRCRDG